MKKRRLLSVILSLVLAMSISVTSFATDIPQVTTEQAEIDTEVETETPEVSDEEVVETETPEVSGEETGDAETPQEEGVETEVETTAETPAEETNEGEEIATLSLEEADATAETDEWTVADFTYTDMSQTLNGCDYTREFTISGRAIAGFSESGLEKVKTNTDLVLPAVDDKGETLVGVASNAFNGQGLTSVKFPSGMMVDYDDTVTNVITKRGNFIIGYGAFSNNNLTSLNLPEGVIAVMPYAFRGNQLAEVTLPHTIWWIENSSFAYNELTTVGFPKTCDFQLQIHAFAFAENNIKSVRLPDYVEVVEKKAFYFNPGMEECPADAPEEEQGFGGVVYMYTDNADLANEERIHHIERTAESQKSWHQKLIIGSKPVEENEWTVDDFTYEGSVITGLSESGIAKRATNKDLVLPDKNPAGEYITEIAAASAGGYGLFATETEGFDSVVLPMKLEKIGAFAFQSNGLKSVAEFPQTLKEIGNVAFQTNNLTSVILPDNVTVLGTGAFATNPLLETIILSKGLTEISASAFGCSSDTEYMTNLTELVIPEGITKIGSRAFAGNNIKNIVIPSTVKEIGTYAFSTKNYLNDECTVTLPEGLETIGNRAFRNKVIKEIELPSTVTGIKAQTFEKEYSDGSGSVVTKVYVTKAQYADTKNFKTSEYHEYVIKVDPNDTVWDAYDFTYAEGAETKLETLDGSSLTLTPYEITGFSELGLAKVEKNPNVIIPATSPEGTAVTGIGRNAFKGNKTIESVTFPEGAMVDYDGPEGMLAEGLTQRGNFVIGYGAFYNCSNLKTVTIPEGVILIDTYAFRNCALDEVVIPHTVGWINAGAFAGNVIEFVTFAEKHDFNLYIGNQVFMTNLIKAVQLPQGVENVGKMAFVYNTGMEPISSEAPSTYKASAGYGVVYMYADEAAASESRIYHVDNATNICYAQKLITDTEMPEDLQPWGADDFTYSDGEDGTTTITGLSSAGIAKLEKNPNMIIPVAGPDGKTVVAIGASAFDAGPYPAEFKVTNKITSVRFPNTVKTIGNFAFRNTQLTEVILPDSVETLGMGAFMTGQGGTIEKVVLSSKLTAIPASCFSGGNSGKITEVIIPEGVTEIGNNAFAASPIASLSLPSTLEKIGNSAFAQHQLTELTIPDKVKTIGSSAFSQVQAGVESTLTTLVLGKSLEEIGTGAFRKTSVTEVELPSTVTVLHNHAFRDAVKGTVSVYTSNKAHLDGTMPKVVVEGSGHKVIYSNLIGNGWAYDDFTFDGATVTGWSEKGNITRLTNKKLVIPEINPETGEAITAIGDSAFKIPDDEVEQLKDGVYSPNGMTSVVIPNTVTTIGAKAFEYNSLTTVDFSENLTTIGTSAFHGNTLQTVVLPDNVTSMGDGAFATNNITSLTISKGLTKIPAGAFSMNIWLEQVEIPNTITEIGQTAFAGARLTSLTIPESVTKIGEKAFHLHHLTELVVPGNVKEIGVSAFEGTPKAITLKKLTLEEGIETIGANAFKEGYLESVKLPDSLISLDATAFEANAGTNNDHVVVCYTDNYKHLEFPESTSHKIVYNTEWAAEDFTYTDNEDGATITGLSESGKVKVGYNTNVIIPTVSPDGKTVTAIGASAFDAGTTPGAYSVANKITSVKLPETLKSIGNFAFRNTQLKEVILPDCVETLGMGAFMVSQEGTIEKVVFSKNLTVIPASCFAVGSNGKITEVVIPEGVTEIGGRAFTASPITSLSLPSTLVEIGTYAFAQHQLTKLTLPDSVTELGTYAFTQHQEGVESTLATVTLGAGLEKIGNAAFRGCAIAEVTLPEGLKTLHKNAFQDGTKGVVTAYTTNYEHLSKLAASTYHKLVFNGEWAEDCFTYEGTVITGLSEKGQAVVENNKEMIIPNETPDGQKVTEIANGAFKGLGLTDVTLPDSLEKIGEEAFAANKLTEVDLPDTMKEVAENAFTANEQVVELITDSEEVYANLKDNKFDGAVLVDKTPADKPEDKPAEKPEDDKSAETGDMANTLPMSVMMLVSLAIIAAVLMKKRVVR